MLTDPKRRSQAAALWDKFWTGSPANPFDIIQQISYLLYLKQLETTRRPPNVSPSPPARAEGPSQSFLAQSFGSA
jgi:hypothetical protein